ncbi:MAG TPA: 2OG-Fe(II) oxygenase [Allosphingosinicella sp.]|nr:2OG-Fe(II) oxygenase [Allosphingosinicella sp.]
MAIIHDVPQAFSAAECDTLVALGERVGLVPATVWAGAGDQVDPAARSARTSHHPRGPETGWIYERLDRLFAEAGDAFGLAVGPLTEPLQILRYDEGGHFRTWHSDAGYDAMDRRLVSVSVELTALGDHEGGDLEIIPDTVGKRRTLARGGARFFPSRAIHRVTPVTSGVRHALVIWTGGRA